MTGGRGEDNRHVLKTCYKFDIVTKKIAAVNDLNKVRENHSSTACGNKIAVFGGSWELGDQANIEVLKDHVWVLIHENAFTARDNPIACALDD